MESSKKQKISQRQNLTSRLFFRSQCPILYSFISFGPFEDLFTAESMPAVTLSLSWLGRVQSFSSWEVVFIHSRSLFDWGQSCSILWQKISTTSLYSPLFSKYKGFRFYGILNLLLVFMVGYWLLTVLPAPLGQVLWATHHLRKAFFSSNMLRSYLFGSCLEICHCGACDSLTRPVAMEKICDVL